MNQHLVTEPVKKRRVNPRSLENLWHGPKTQRAGEVKWTPALRRSLEELHHKHYGRITEIHQGMCAYYPDRVKYPFTYSGVKSALQRFRICNIKRRRKVPRVPLNLYIDDQLVKRLKRAAENRGHVYLSPFVTELLETVLQDNLIKAILDGR